MTPRARTSINTCPPVRCNNSFRAYVRRVTVPICGSWSVILGVDFDPPVVRAWHEEVRPALTALPTVPLADWSEAVEYVRAASMKQPLRPTVAMAIKVQCPSCGEKLRGRDELAGRRVKCPKCGRPFQLSLQQESLPASESGRASASTSADNMENTAAGEPGAATSDAAIRIDIQNFGRCCADINRANIKFDTQLIKDIGDGPFRAGKAAGCSTFVQTGTTISLRNWRFEVEKLIHGLVTRNGGEKLRC